MRVLESHRHSCCVCVTCSSHWTCPAQLSALYKGTAHPDAPGVWRWPYVPVTRTLLQGASCKHLSFTVRTAGGPRGRRGSTPWGEGWEPSELHPSLVPRPSACLVTTLPPLSPAETSVLRSPAHTGAPTPPAGPVGLAYAWKVPSEPHSVCTPMALVADRRLPAYSRWLRSAPRDSKQQTACYLRSWASPSAEGSEAPALGRGSFQSVLPWFLSEPSLPKGKIQSVFVSYSHTLIRVWFFFMLNLPRLIHCVVSLS